MRKVYAKKDVADFLNKNSINIKINAETDKGPELCKKYKISGFPTIIFINAEAEEIDRISGYLPPEAFIKKCHEIVNGAGTLDSIMKKHKEEPDKTSHMYDLAQKYANRGDNENSINYLKMIAEKDPENKQGFTIKANFELAKLETVELLSKNINKISVNKGQYLEDYITPLTKFIEKYKDTNDEKVGETYYLIGIIYSKLMNYPKAMEYFDKAFPILEKNAQFMNDYAWTIKQQNKENTSKALKLAEKAVELEPENTLYLETLADLYFEMELYEKAVSILRKAIDIEPDNMILQSKLDKYQKLM